MLLVFDLDGVVYRGKTPIPGAIPALNRLAEAGHTLFYLTNNSTATRADYAARLSAMGIPAVPEGIMTSAYATGLYLGEVGAAGKSVFIIGERGLAEEMQLAGLRVLDGDAQEQADFVVVGLDRDLTYAKLATAHRHMSGGARLVATNRDGTLPIEGGELPGGGAMVAALEACSRPAEVTIGKPEPYCWQELLSLTGVPPAQALMVGDRSETDILGAKRVGMITVLVLTGATQPEDLPNLPLEQQPDHVIPALADLPALLENGALA